MADYSSSTPMSQPEVISILKDTLCAQQHLLQKLYNELDAEREASATAASEALSVILRLQGEKAAVKMEAEQYKRLAEEKMCHAEESFAIIEDIIYQKEMEVAALDYQVQACRYKLLSMGCADPGGGEIKFPENLLQRSESLAGDTSLGRRNSAPVLLKYKKAMMERESSLSPEPDLVSKNADEQTTGQEMINDLLGSDLDNKKADSGGGGGIMSYGEEIRKLDIRVKEIAGANYAMTTSRLSAGSYLSNLQPEAARSPSLQLSINNGNLNKANEIDQIIKHSRMPRKGEAANSYPCSPSSVHDVFEVPQVSGGQLYESSPNINKKKTANNEILQSKDVAVKLSSAKDHDQQPDWLKKLFQSARNDDKSTLLCKPSHIAAIDRAVIVQPPISSVGNEISGISEVERVAAEYNNSREEELKLLKEIKEKLNLLQDEIRREKASKKSSPSSICPLPEAMLHFWL